VNSDDLKGALGPVVKQHYPAIVEPLRAGDLLRAIDDYVGQPTTVAALKLAPYLFVRSGELRMMEYSELNLDAAEWRIPGARMKMGEPHIVPLSS
jgi:integrase